jgi:hypothetical protein
MKLEARGFGRVKAFFRNQVVVTKGKQTRRSDQPAAYLSRSSTFRSWSNTKRSELLGLGSEKKSEGRPYKVCSKNGLSESWSGTRQIESKGKGGLKPCPS